MTITLDTCTVEYTLGAHYAYVFNKLGRELEPFSFAWNKNKTTELDFTEALAQWIEDN